MFSVKFKTTEELPEPSPRLIDQIIGQDEALSIVLSAVKNKRHVILLGDPGVGKSMIVKAVGELIEKSPSSDFKPYTIISKPNLKNPEKPIVELIEGTYKEDVEDIKPKVIKQPPGLLTLMLIMIFFTLIMSYLVRGISQTHLLAVITTTAIVSFALAFVVVFLAMFGATRGAMSNTVSPLDLKPVVLYECKKRPVVKASAYNVTKLLGDVRHCPLGGKPPLGTPPHKRIILGAIHEAHKGILYVDEIKTMPPEVQDYILTALQDKCLSISGRNPNSSGATVETNPIPCDFILIMSGNMDDINNLRAPLLDRIDYKIVLRNKMDNTQENRDKLLQFIVQEIRNNNLNHMTYEACCEIVRIAQLFAGSKDKLTLRLRKLSNIIKMANDIAMGKSIQEIVEELSGDEDTIKKEEKEDKLKSIIEALKIGEKDKKKEKPKDKNTIIEKIEKKVYIDVEHIRKVMESGIYSMSKQVAIDYLREFKRYKHIVPNDTPKIGVIYGLAVIGSDGMGDVTKIITQIVDSKNPGTHLLNISGDIAKHSITLASALSKKYISEGKLPLKPEKDIDLNRKEIYIQFSQSYSKIDGDSATAAVCLSIISALLEIPLKQDFAITGSLDLNGNILAVGGINEKINAAREYGFKRVIIPESNLVDVIDDRGIEIIPAKRLDEIIPLVFEYDSSKK
ncbi:ATP-dependent protease LonB [Methanofervidicoccus sp. A16]|uniref:ATP-dependent protease LonB n=1 Tax=Methanofervidicoccus sp. A16 TaxID=2607662 RepID=UPI00118C10AA|nr:ATP-dependent protease LonB [Methanofervidicoccus sp. A16]AXI25176.1 ATP-dependent protease LonB [Methanofervidicoccus sp. A16]MBW9220078.1 ATP-dependent protease LonB [Methanothermococcus sp. SCGC AD-155-N22]